MSVVIRATNCKAGESEFDFCPAKTFLLAIVRQGLQPTIFLNIKNRKLLYLVVSMSGLTADHSPPSSAEG